MGNSTSHSVDSEVGLEVWEPERINLDSPGPETIRSSSFRSPAFMVLLVSVAAYLWWSALNRSPQSSVPVIPLSPEEAAQQEKERQLQVAKYKSDREAASEMLEKERLKFAAAMNSIVKSEQDDRDADDDEEEPNGQTEETTKEIATLQVTKDKSTPASTTITHDLLLSNLQRKSGYLIAPGFHATLTTLSPSSDETSVESEQELKLSISPHLIPTSGQTDTEQQALIILAQIMLLVPESIVVLHLNIITATSEDEDEDEEVAIVSTKDSLIGSRFTSKSFSRNIPSTVSLPLATLLGLPKLSSADLEGRESWFSKVLEITQPDEMTFSPHSSVPQLDPSLLFCRMSPLVLAGRNVFGLGQRQHQHQYRQDDKGSSHSHEETAYLPYLELSSFIPICDRQPSHFSFSEWNIGTLAIPYRGMIVVSKSGKGKKASTENLLRGAEMLPSMMWDPEYGFVKMMQGRAENGKDSGTGRGGGGQVDSESTRIILLIKDLRLADEFRAQIERLVDQSARKAKTSEQKGIRQRFEVLRRSLFFSVDSEGEGSRGVARVWPSVRSSSSRMSSDSEGSDSVTSTGEVETDYSRDETDWESETDEEGQSRKQGNSEKSKGWFGRKVMPRRGSI